MTKEMAKWVGGLFYIAAFSLLLSAIITMLKNVFKLNISPEQAKVLVIGLTIVFGLAIFRRVVGM